MSILYKKIDPESGVRWCVRAVFFGDDYGRNHCLTYGPDDGSLSRIDNPLIEFYDMDCGAAEILKKSDDVTEAYLAKEYGHFVSRYYWDTLKDDDWSERGLNLHGGVDRWSVSSKFMTWVMQELGESIEEWLLLEEVNQREYEAMKQRAAQ